MGTGFRDQTGIFVSFHKAEGGMLSSCPKAALLQLRYDMIPELVFDKVFRVLEEITEL